MVYTITLNPLLNRVVEVEELVYDDVNRVVEEGRYPGGKGIDVSRVIRELGGQSIAMGFAGGYNGLEMVGRLVEEGIICDFTNTQGETRAHIAIYQRKKKLRTLLSTPCPPLSTIEIDELFRKVRRIPEGSYVVISGNIPQGVSSSFYAQLITTLKDKEIRVILDTDEEALKIGVEARPFLIKPNIHEFGRLVETNVGEIGDILDLAAPLREKVEHIVVSLGARGALGISKEGCYHAVPPKINVRSSMGAGDALVAGIVCSFSEGTSFADALKLGVACGTAAALSPDGNLCNRQDVDLIKKDVLIEKI